MTYYKYEMHMHTSECSKCAETPAAELVRVYKEGGYSGVIITDHFVQGSSTIPWDISWERRMELYCEGYKRAKEEGDKIGIDVFFGCEFPYKGLDYLIYGLTKEFLVSHPEICGLTVPELSGLVRENGGYIAQAHPCRTARYIPAWTGLTPEFVEGFEVINSRSDDPDNHHDKTWKLAAEYPELIRMSGTDIHGIIGSCLCGMAFDHKIKDINDMIASLRRREGLLIIDGVICDTEGNPVE